MTYSVMTWYLSDDESLMYNRYLTTATYKHICSLLEQKCEVIQIQRNSTFKKNTKINPKKSCLSCFIVWKVNTRFIDTG